MYKYETLVPEVINILRERGTEAPFSGCYQHPVDKGTYLCRGCGLPLFRLHHQFSSSCGWPSFDDEIPNAITRRMDEDGRRVEIICARCQGHLGHVFEGEEHTEKNLRHCVNSLAIEKVDNESVQDTDEAIFAAGCFWGVEHLFAEYKGVLKTEVGYSGGNYPSPNYETVCQKKTGHYEATRIIFDPKIISYEELVKFFFEIHNPGQAEGQGPDIGPQYRSAIFCLNPEQKKMAEKVITELKNKAHSVTTKILDASVFWPAEDYHQQYYKKTGHAPYCHRWTKKF